MEKFSPMSGPGYSGFSMGALYYTLHYNGILTKALEKARLGTLSPTWRNDLTSSSDNPTPAIFGDPKPIGDAQQLAIQEITEMPPAGWEPGNATHWRHALDAWYTASRLVLGSEFRGSLTRHSQLLEKMDTLLLHSVSHLVPEDLDNPDRGNHFWDVVAGPTQRVTDKTTRNSINTYITQRDWLTASYLAGLAAGGTPGPDWRQWLRERANEWSTEGGYQRRVEIETHSITHLFDKPLPTYWQR